MITTKKLKSISQTGKKMAELVKKYSGDINEMAGWGLIDYYNYVSTLPYYRDPYSVEMIQRPRNLLLESNPFRDCDDKTILMCAWAQENKIPWRMVAVGNSRFQHVFPEFRIKNKWNCVDATYPTSQIFRPKKWKLRRIIG